MKNLNRILGLFRKTEDSAEMACFKQIYSQLSEKGGRKVNQDAVSYQQVGPYRCWLVADGLGGHGGGEIASALVCKTIVEEFSAQPALENIEQYYRAANNAVLEAQRHDRYTAMQSTIVGLVTDGTKACWGHIGDSRLYLFRAGKLIHQTRDHSVPQALADAGQIERHEIRQHEDRNRLIRAVGSQKAFRAAISEPTELMDGDAFLLCTDGFWDYVLEDEMVVDLMSSTAPEDWLRRMQQRVLKRASGEFDNYTALAVWISGRSSS